MREINLHVTNTLGGIQILNILDRAGGGTRVSDFLLKGELSSAWVKLTQSASYVLSSDTGRKEFLTVIGTLVGVRILKDVTGFNKILSIGSIHIYV